MRGQERPGANLQGRTYLTTEEASKITHITVGSMANMRSDGYGPPYVKAGRRVLYPEDLLREWLDNSLTTPKAVA